jgi:hypothetical protein
MLLPFASQLEQADAVLSERLAPELLRAIVERVPESWQTYREDGFATPEEQRAAYVAYLSARLEAPRAFAEEARDAYARGV